jgi:hypothetical protein
MLMKSHKKVENVLGQIELDEDQNEYGIPNASRGITYAVMTIWIQNVWDGSKFIEITNIMVCKKHSSNILCCCLF